MCRKSIYLISFVLVLGTALTSTARADLIGWWRFDEGSGTTTYDSSGNGNHGTLHGNPQWVAGKIGGALEFNGTDSMIDIPYSTDMTPSTGTTMTAWVFPTDTTRSCIVGQFEGYGMALMTGLQLKSVIWGADWVLSDVTIPEQEWSHVAMTWDVAGSERMIFLNGELVGQRGDAAVPNVQNNFGIGLWVGWPADWGDDSFMGIIDDVQVHDLVLSGSEILVIMKGEGYPYALAPDPSDGALHETTWVTLSWKPGDFAVSHDVYLGENFDDVNNGTGDTFRDSLPLGTEFYIAGFFGYPYPEGLVPGTTYYWRIDEVNDADPNSPWKGDVWSFTVPPKTAYNSVPANGAKFIDSEGTILTWTPGFGSKFHYVYFGDDYDTVANATGAPFSPLTTYSPGPLELEKTYYWRVDESDGTNTFTGEVWSFTTAKEGGGLKGEYFNNNNLSGEPVLTRMDPEINFNWGNATVPGQNSPDESINVNNFSARWSGELEVDLTDAYTFEINANNGFRLWLDGQLIIDYWDNPTTSSRKSDPIELIGGATYSIQMDYFEGEDTAIAELYWASSTKDRQIIPQAALSPPIKASSPNPTNGATGTKMSPVLQWNAGDYAASHEVYFGTDADAVANADKNSPEYKGTKAIGDESYDPSKLAWFTSYFWRIDEVNATNPDSPWTGNVWSFTTGDFLLIDNFEDYNAGDNQIWFSWHDGLGAGAVGTPDYIPGNGTGSAVGDETTNSYTEETIVHGGRQAMPLTYDNDKQGFAKYSETELTLTSPRDWTEENVAELSLWFRGYPGSVGSFVEGPVGTYTMTGSGTDIWDNTDQFHFAYKMLTGQGSIMARVQSIQETNTWAKAGVMIRETLDSDSAHAFACVTPANGVAMQYRPSTGGASVNNNQTGVAAPYWVKLERSISGLFTVSHSANGTSWQAVTGATPQNIPMGSNVYIGLALTAHDAALTCQAVFSNITATGNITGQWTHQDIGITSNDAETLYVAVSNTGGTPAVVVHDDPTAAQINTWTEWVIPLQTFADQGINLTDVDRIAIGLGTKGNTTVPGGSGKMYFDDIRLYRPRPEPLP